MRSVLSTVLVFAVLLLAVPMLPLFAGRYPPSQAKAIIEKNISADGASAAPSDKSYAADTLKVLDISSGEVEEISAIDYVTGAVAASIPAEFEPETLKAQAVAAYTYALRQKLKAETAPDKSLKGAYFSNDSSKYQAFFTESQQRHYYGENYDEYHEKIKSAAEAVAGVYMSYEGEPIIAAFHSLSAGKTESAENIWGSDIPYLVSIDSKYDETAPKFLKEYEFTEAEMKDKLSAAFPDMSIEGGAESWFEKPELSDAGTVLTQSVCGEEHTGQELRAALGLRSAAFDVRFADGTFTVTVRGCGHGVGMSQFGANELAKSGKKYDEILKYYYKGIELCGQK